MSIAKLKKCKQMRRNQQNQPTAWNTLFKFYIPTSFWLKSKDIYWTVMWECWKNAQTVSLTAFRHRGSSATNEKDVLSGLEGKDTNMAEKQSCTVRSRHPG